MSIPHNGHGVPAILKNPVPGSKVTIAGGGYTKTIIVPHDHRPPTTTGASPTTTYTPLSINIDDFPAKEAGKVTNMTITVSDPSDENIKSTGAFDIEVQSEIGHQPHSFKFNPQELLDAIPGTSVTTIL